MFARVVQRQGWVVELIEAGRPEPKTSNFPGRDEALQFAVQHRPEWIEVGVVVLATEAAPQHHRWQTLRRGIDGHYAESLLSWGGRPAPAGP